jgi:hypothetical protein
VPETFLYQVFEMRARHDSDGGVHRVTDGELASVISRFDDPAAPLRCQ